MSMELTKEALSSNMFKDLLTIKAKSTEPVSFDRITPLLKVIYECPICHENGALYITNNPEVIAVCDICTVADKYSVKYIILLNTPEEIGRCSSSAGQISSIW